MALAYLPAITGFISILVAVFLAPIPKWQDIIGKFVKAKIKTIAIVILVILTFVSVPTTEIPDGDIAPETTASVVDETNETIHSTTNTEPTSAPTTEATSAPTTEVTSAPNTEVTSASTTEATSAPTTEATSAPTTEATSASTTEATNEPPTETTNAPTIEPTTAPTEDNGRDYVLNTNTMKFHYPSCSSAGEIKDKNKAYFHGTRDELIAKGYSPCGRCDP